MVSVFPDLGLRTRRVWAVATSLVALAASGCGEAESADAAELGGGALVEHRLWVEVGGEMDPFGPAPEGGDCVEGVTHLPEHLGGEFVYSITTTECPHMTVTQGSRLPLSEGDPLRIRFYNSQLVADGPATARVRLALGDETVWQVDMSIPHDFAFHDETVPSPASFPEGTPVYFHVSNHGANEYALIDFSRESGQ